MHRQTRYMLALGIAASTTMAVNPCHAQTVTDNIDNSSDKALLTSEPDSKTNTNNPTEKSVTPSDAVSQTPVENAAIPQVNPRIPIPSRIFPALQQ